MELIGSRRQVGTIGWPLEARTRQACRLDHFALPARLSAEREIAGVAQDLTLLDPATRVARRTENMTVVDEIPASASWSENSSILDDMPCVAFRTKYVLALYKISSEVHRHPRITT